MKKILPLLLLPLILMSFKPKEKVHVVEINTTMGKIKVMLYNQTPKHRDNFLKLVNQHFYDSLLFHRVIKDFMIQGGDPDSKKAQPGVMLGNGDVGYTVPAEFNPNLYHKKGVLAAARDNNPEKASSGCQFYIVQVVSVEGRLTDHYNPANKTVNLSPDIYSGSNITAAAIAAHECGHAVQHATAYAWLQMRSKLVPVVQFSSNMVQWVLLAGILTINIFPQLLLAGIVLFALTTLFSVITLPVEFDASKRALAWLDNSQVMSSVDHAKAKDGLQWAAMTYVIAAISSIATLLYYVMLFNRRN